jgi:hypothetical protein
MTSEMTGTHVVVRLVATDAGMRLDARTTSGDRLGDPRDTRLPSSLEPAGQKRALLAIVRRLDTAHARGEDLSGVLDQVALIRLNRAGAVIMPRSAKRAPARLSANRRSDKRGVTRGQTMDGADHSRG